MNNRATLGGGCQCGNVRIKVTGEPMVAVNCHCSVCQGLSGAGHIFVLVYPAGNVDIQGKLSQFRYKADSGKMATRHFCPTCGAQLYGTSESMPGTYGINAACLKDTSAYRPKLTAYAKRLQAWDHLAEGIPSFPAMPPMSA
ncbi:MAG TPA: GFA family protein [Aestuariivirgaceae bacterium]|jgi:hypothetical protein